MNNVRTRANEDYRQRRSYRSRRGNHMVTICLYVGIISFLCIISGMVLLLYGFFKYSFYDATPCNEIDPECCIGKNAKCDPNKSKHMCSNMGSNTVNGVTTYMCKYNKDNIPQPEKKELDKNNKIAHILLYSGAGLLITTLIIYNVF